MRKFPDINQFRHTVDAVTNRATYAGKDAQDAPVYDKSRPKPVLTFNGTTKLHGTNAGVAFNLEDGTRLAQSRERVLSVDEDNHGFCAWVESPAGESELRMLLSAAVHGLGRAPLETVLVFGEWCGPGVNGKTAIGQLPTRWVVIAVLVTLKDGSEQWLELPAIASTFNAACDATSRGINFICDFKQWSVDIDFNDPGSVIDELERLTLEVEDECPVAAALGNKGMGEGIVWVCQDPKYGRLVFKTKGLKHKGTRSHRVVDIAPEVLASQAAFADAVLTESRLEQGFELIRARHGKVTLDRVGDFLQWVGTDVLKEESDTLKASGLDRKLAMGTVNRQAKAWLLPRF